MDRLESMSLLIAAVETGSFSAASRKLGVPLPTVSRKIADLEAHLNARLLVRSTRKLALTDAGSAYLAASKSILEQVGDAERAASGEYVTPKGELVVGAPIAFGRLHVLPVVNAFLATFPDINVQLVLSDRNAQLVDEHIDVAVRIGRLADSSMLATRVGAVRWVVCASPRFLAKHGTPKTPADLAEFPCVVFSDLASGPPWMFAAKGGKPAGIVQPRARLTVNTAEAAVDAAVAGIGVTHVFSYQAARAVKDGKLKIGLKDYELDPIPVSVIHPGQGRPPFKLRSFLEFAVPRLRKSLVP
jgi:DNA-binding transcriptional LysR family regulator